MAAAQQQGAQVHLHERVCGWCVDPKTQDVIVQTDKGKHRAARLVITGGAWMAQLIPEFQVTLHFSSLAVGSHTCTSVQGSLGSDQAIMLCRQDQGRGMLGWSIPCWPNS